MQGSMVYCDHKRYMFKDYAIRAEAEAEKTWTTEAG